MRQECTENEHISIKSFRYMHSRTVHVPWFVFTGGLHFLQQLPKKTKSNREEKKKSESHSRRMEEKKHRSEKAVAIPPTDSLVNLN